MIIIWSALQICSTIEIVFWVESNKERGEWSVFCSFVRYFQMSIISAENRMEGNNIRRMSTSSLYDWQHTSMATFHLHKSPWWLHNESLLTPKAQLYSCGSQLHSIPTSMLKRYVSKLFPWRTSDIDRSKVRKEFLRFVKGVTQMQYELRLLLIIRLFCRLLINDLLSFVWSTFGATNLSLSEIKKFPF